MPVQLTQDCTVLEHEDRLLSQASVLKVEEALWEEDGLYLFSLVFLYRLLAHVNDF